MTLIPLNQAPVDGLALAHALSFNRPWSAEELTELMQGTGVMGVAARGDDGAVEGFVLLRAVAGEAEVLTLCVAPWARLLGIGRALTQAAVGLAAGAGAETVWLEVAEDNAAAISLYRGSGFQEAGRRPAYYLGPDGERIDALVLKRTLNTSLS